MHAGFEDLCAGHPTVQHWLGRNLLEDKPETTAQGSAVQCTIEMAQSGTAVLNSSITKVKATILQHATSAEAVLVPRGEMHRVSLAPQAVPTCTGVPCSKHDVVWRLLCCTGTDWSLRTSGHCSGATPNIDRKGKSLCAKAARSVKDGTAEALVNAPGEVFLGRLRVAIAWGSDYDEEGTRM